MRDETAEQQLDRKKAKLLQSLIADLSFWGNLEEAPPKKEHESKMSSSDDRMTWRAAVDSVSGKTYYYDAVTRRTQWEKPAEIREMERRQRHEKKRMDRLFFKQMEQNIRDNLKNGNVSPGVVLAEEKEEKAQQQQQQQQQPPLPPRARTISGMDEIMLQEALGAPAFKTQQQQHNSSVMIPRRDAHGRPPLNPARLNTLPSELSLEFSPEQSDRVSQHPLVSREESYASLSSGFQSELDLRGEALLDGPMDEDVYEVADLHKNQQHVRRNTGGTIYAESTMMNPDVQATIKCVCGVYRAHIIQASSKRSGKSPVSTLSPSQSLFLDERPKTKVPTLDEIITFYQDFYVRSQMEHDTIIMSLIYVERLLKEDTTIVPVPENWRSVLFSCMVLASKVWDDLSMWNVDFSNVCGRSDRAGLIAYTLPRINQLELALLKALNFNVKVPASEYAKYYFLIRSMLIKSGLLTEEKPMNAESLQQQQHNNNNSASPDRTHRGTRSMNDYRSTLAQQQGTGTVCLEQLMSMTTN